MVIKRKNRIDFHRGVLTDTGKYIVVPERPEFALSQAKSFTIRLFVQPLAITGTHVLLNSGGSGGAADLTIGINATGFFFQVGAAVFYSTTSLTDSIRYIDFINDATTGEIRGYFGTQKVISYINANPFTFFDNDLYLGKHQSAGLPAKAIFAGLAIFNVCTDQNYGFLNRQGNWIHADLHPYCLANYTLQETSGSIAYDYVEQFNYSKHDIVKDFGSGFGGYNGWIVESNSVLTGNSISLYCFGNSVSDGSIYRPFDNGITGYKIPATVYDSANGTLKYQIINLETAAVLEQNTIPSNTELNVFNSFGVKVKLRLIMESIGASSVTIQFQTATEVYKLKGNHINLIGYDPADILANGAARVDLFTKATAVSLDGSGLEISTGLPELKKAFKLADFSAPVELNKTIDNGTEPFSIFAAFALLDDAYLDYGNPFFELTLENGQFQFTTNRLVIWLSSYGLIPNGGVEIWQKHLKKGILTFCFVKKRNRKVAFYINGIKMDLSHFGTGLINEVHSSEPDFNLRSITSHKINGIYADADNLHAISYGIKKGAITQREYLELHKNARLGNPMNVAGWELFHQFNRADESAFLDVSGKGRNASNPYYPGAVSSPSHPDYPIKNITEFR